jgi:hypothetical protein
LTEESRGATLEKDREKIRIPGGWKGKDMRGAFFIVMLLALLVTGYLVVRDLKEKQEGGTAKIEAIERASRLGDTVNKASEAQEERMRKILED